MHIGLLRCVVAAAAMNSVAAVIGFSYGNCAPPTVDVASERLTVGDRTWLCVHFNGRVTAVFTPKVDEYDAVSLTGSNYALPDSSGYVVDGVGAVDAYDIPNTWNYNCSEKSFNTTRLYATFDVSVLGVSTPLPRIFKTIDINPCLMGNGSVIYTVPMYTIIVSLSEGAVEYISFDDGCYFCASNGAECIATALDLNTSTVVPDGDLVGCRQPSSYCYPSSTDGSNSSATQNITSLPVSPCDLKIYIVWTGTDSRGTYLTSAGRRLSRFRQYSSASAYQASLYAITDAQNLAQTVANSATSIPGRVLPNRELRAGNVDDASEEAGTPVVAEFRGAQPLPNPRRAEEAVELEAVSVLKH